LLTLRLTAPARFHFLHGGVLRGLLSAALGQHELPVGVVPFAPESGRARFDTGEAYRLGLTLVGEESAGAERILTGLERVGREEPPGRGATPTLGGNFRLEAAAPLPPADPGGEAGALLDLAGPGKSLTLRFLSPLRLERPEGLQPKDDGGVRPLAVPTVRDRVAQRAVAQVLAPALDTLLDDSSYAYRKGFSRAGAARAVERAYAEGYRFVLDADIEAFFDNVPWARLFEKLAALFPLDPPLLDLLAAWVQAPVVFDGRTIDRTRFRRGLPQGAAISPLLANLYLDELDEELTRQGFRLVRYADDFVVLARDVAEARRAREVAQEALAGLGLHLNQEDTALRSIDMGFSYLGYLFVRSLVLEQPPKEPASLPKLLMPEDVPAASWLAQVPLLRLREVVAAGGTGRRPRQVRLVPLAAAAAAGLPATRPLYVTSPDASLHLDRGSLVIERDGAAHGQPRELRRPARPRRARRRSLFRLPGRQPSRRLGLPRPQTAPGTGPGQRPALVRLYPAASPPGQRSSSARSALSRSRSAGRSGAGTTTGSTAGVASVGGAGGRSVGRAEASPAGLQDPAISAACLGTLLLWVGQNSDWLNLRLSPSLARVSQYLCFHWPEIAKEPPNQGLILCCSLG
jgi:hypothetical protein